MNTPTVLISILNWNKAAITLECLGSLRHMARDGMTVEVVVFDNGSEQADYQKLRDGIDASWVQLVRVEKNLGFTGGHNVSLKMAIEKGCDFVWLLNNDATVEPDTLAKLVRAMLADEHCGAVSPVILADDTNSTDVCSCTHDWKSRCIRWAQRAESMKLHQTDPDQVCLLGTAIMLRVDAVRQVGLLDERLFAYYDDNDIGARLAHRGWRSKVVFDATAKHRWRTVSEQPLYYFYLMFRNELIFWHTSMPKEFRKLLWLKIVNQALFNVNRLRRKGLGRQADSALLGVWDFMRGKGGAPDLARKVPLPVRMMCRIAGYLHQKQLRQTAFPAAPAA